MNEGIRSFSEGVSRGLSISCCWLLMLPSGEWMVNFLELCSPRSQEKIEKQHPRIYIYVIYIYILIYCIVVDWCKLCDYHFGVAILSWWSFRCQDLESERCRNEKPQKDAEKSHPTKKKNNTYTLWYTNITMENHHFQWVNPLFLWPFSIALCLFTRG